MIRMRRPLLVLALLALAACSRGGVPRERLQAWVGRPAAELVQAWGTPTREVPDGTGRVLIYEEMERAPSLEFGRQVTNRQAGGYQAAQEVNESLRGPEVYARSYLFWVDPAGTIVRSDVRRP
jgi:hypothetical protein